MSPTAGKTERPSHLSRNVAIGSGAVIAVLVGYLTIEAFRDGSPAVITHEIAAGEGWTQDSFAYVPVDVANEGGETAADVEVETSFAVPGVEPIVKRTRIDFLAGGERRRFYAIGPRDAPLTVRVIGFQDP
ncbi:MAG TPA: hypothetical protein VFS53_02145 [Gemmatimonadota bacterium]|nr:hypothetical protein [Gemmatimonadota bacterium]